jgi:hypothetical protein
MTAQPTGTPAALVHNLRYNKMLHEHVIVLTVATVPTPHVAMDQRVTVTAMGASIYNARDSVRVHGGSDVPEVLGHLRLAGVPIDETTSRFFWAGIPSWSDGARAMAVWREKLFVLMARNAVRATAFFRLPPNAWSNWASRWRCRPCHGIVEVALVFLGRARQEFEIGIEAAIQRAAQLRNGPVDRVERQAGGLAVLQCEPDVVGIDERALGQQPQVRRPECSGPYPTIRSGTGGRVPFQCQRRRRLRASGPAISPLSCGKKQQTAANDQQPRSMGVIPAAIPRSPLTTRRCRAAALNVTTTEEHVPAAEPTVGLSVKTNGRRRPASRTSTKSWSCETGCRR